MSSTAQVLANQANAQMSTGPKSADGKTASSRNAFTHGLTAARETLFANVPETAEEFANYSAALYVELDPKSTLEEEAFTRFAFAKFQASRACYYEIQAEQDMLADFGNQDLERRWMRFTQTRIRLSREADAAFKELEKTKALRVEAERQSNERRALARVAAEIRAENRSQFSSSRTSSRPAGAAAQNEANPQRTDFEIDLASSGPNPRQ